LGVGVMRVRRRQDGRNAVVGGSRQHRQRFALVASAVIDTGQNMGM
jgi:hypothetical protein